MEPRHERLPERRDTILAAGARLKVTLNEPNGSHDVEIEGNRQGLQALAAICNGLAELAADELLTPANHYHLDEKLLGYRIRLDAAHRLLSRGRGGRRNRDEANDIKPGEFAL